MHVFFPLPFLDAPQKDPLGVFSLRPANAAKTPRRRRSQVPHDLPGGESLGERSGERSPEPDESSLLDSLLRDLVARKDSPEVSGGEVFFVCFLFVVFLGGWCKRGRFSFWFFWGGLFWLREVCASGDRICFEKCQMGQKK